MENFFNPRSIAIIGASNTPKKAGYNILKNLIDWNYQGKIFPINPNSQKILGLKSYDNIAQIPEEIDLAIIAIAPKFILNTILECKNKKVKALIIETSELTPEGSPKEIQDKVTQLVSNDFRIMGHNSIGILNVYSNTATSLIYLEKPKKGNISIFGQTGMISSGFTRMITSSEYYGISKIACIGNKIDIDDSDILEYLKDDKETKVIAMYLEGIKNGPRFNATLKKIAKIKPTIILKGGKTEKGKQASASHTGSIAGNSEVLEGFFKQLGVIEAKNFTELFQFIKIFSFLGEKAGSNIGIVSITGSGCVLSADACDKYGLNLAMLSEVTINKIKEIFPTWQSIQNPIDVWAAIEKNGPEKTYEHVITALYNDKNIDMILVINTLIEEADFNVKKVFQKIKKEKPILVCLEAGEKKIVEKWKKDLELMEIPTFFEADIALKCYSVYNSFYTYTKKN